MFPDYSSLSSYTPLIGKYAMLGDDTLVLIMGYGMTIHRLNGKVIKTRNALHIPALRGPFFSICRQRRRQGCGIFASYDLRSFILFPDFILKVEDSQYNLLSFVPLEASYEGSFDFVEPKQSPPDLPALALSGRPSNAPIPALAGPTLIPDNDVPLEDPAPNPLSPQVLPSPSSPTPPSISPATSEELSDADITDEEIQGNSCHLLTLKQLHHLPNDPAKSLLLLSLRRTLQLPVSLATSLTPSSFIASLVAVGFAISAIWLTPPKAPL